MKYFIWLGVDDLTTRPQRGERKRGTALVDAMGCSSSTAARQSENEVKSREVAPPSKILALRPEIISREEHDAIAKIQKQMRRRRALQCANKDNHWKVM